MNSEPHFMRMVYANTSNKSIKQKYILQMDRLIIISKKHKLKNKKIHMKC